MAVYRCKTCGGQLEYIEGQTSVQCEYCGIVQTIGKVRSDNIQNLFERADNLRLNYEFDRAEKIYEKIIEEDSKCAEAYWGIVLCRYGIVYVDDPRTGKKLPTCNRVSYESVASDGDYKKAIEYSDVIDRKTYQMLAVEFDRIQKEILVLAAKEEPYDVFICYKETGTDGKRTQDSVLANDIYHQLTNEGYKVFYAAITLEDKLGSAYEPIIFAALNSSKVMIVLGTKPEYFNAIWVKNEWSRYLNLIRKGAKKVLIPAYRDMNPYDLPEEFAHLQAQDMGKIGFIQDLIRGIKKVVVKEEKIVAAPIASQTSTTSNSNIQNLLKRVAAFLRESNWQDANAYCERILDIEMENAEAHLYKLCIELKVKNFDDLSYKDDVEIINRIKTSYNYRNAITYGNSDIKERINKVFTDIQFNANELKYINAKRLYESYQIDDLNKANTIFSSILSHKDSKEYIVLVKEKIEKIKKEEAEAQALAKEREIQNKYNRAVTLYNNHQLSNLKSALEIFKEIINYKDVKKYKEKCEVEIVQLEKERDYNTAKNYSTSNSTANLQIAISTFEKLGDYLDSKELLALCKKRYPSVLQEEEYIKALNFMIKPNLEQLNKAIAIFEKMLTYKNSKQKLQECLKLRKKLTKAIKRRDSYWGQFSLVLKEFNFNGKLFLLLLFPITLPIFTIMYYVNKKRKR